MTLWLRNTVKRRSVCVSCNPGGVPPVSNSLFERSAAGKGALDGSPVPAMSDNGEYVFFDTADALVPQDTNGTLDVYEWHADQCLADQLRSGLGPVVFPG